MNALTQFPNGTRTSICLIQEMFSKGGCDAIDIVLLHFCVQSDLTAHSTTIDKRGPLVHSSVGSARRLAYLN
jgi:hypothetical protein